MSVFFPANGQTLAAKSRTSAGMKPTPRSGCSGFHDQWRIGPVPLRHPPHAIDPLAVFHDELAALVFVDGPGNAVREQPVADGARVRARGDPRPVGPIDPLMDRKPPGPKADQKRKGKAPVTGRWCQAVATPPTTGGPTRTV